MRAQLPLPARLAVAVVGTKVVQRRRAWSSLLAILFAFSLHGQTPDAFNPGANSTINTMIVQPDGKILVGGYFSVLGGQARGCIGRLNEDGSLDVSFNPGTNFVGVVNSLAIQSDGKILVGGDLLSPDGARGILRLLPDGSIDKGFNTTLTGLVTDIYAIAIQSDDRMLVGGYFFTLGGESHTNLGRLNIDGTPDHTFNPDAELAGVYSIAIQSTNKIFVGGAFTALDGQPRNEMGVLTFDGNLYGQFDPAPIKSTVFALALQANGGVLMGGAFTQTNGWSHGIERALPDGTLDTNFHSQANSFVTSIAQQADGRILLGGEFNSLGGQPRAGLGRLSSDGTLDSSLNVSITFTNPALLISPFLSCVALQPDGKILIGGAFDTVGGEQRPNLARLNNTGPTLDLLTFDGVQITWQRSGIIPDLSATSFAVSTNGVDWTSLGEGVRFSGGWRAPVVPVPTNAIVRGRGRVQNGFGNGSSWFIEKSVAVDPHNPPLILTSTAKWQAIPNTFEFDISALVGQVVVVEITSDLSHWAPIATNAISNVPFHFSTTPTQDQVQRFYRLRLQ